MRSFGMNGKDNIHDNHLTQNERCKDMNSIDKSSRVESSEKKTYEPPKAVRLGDMRGGAGACEFSGSNDAECLGDGNSAGLCEVAGSSAGPI